MKRAVRAARSLRTRLLAATLLALLVAGVLAGIGLRGLFQEHLKRQAVAALTAQLDQVTARLEFDASGQPAVDPDTVSDPRAARPYSGLYWQVDRRDPSGDPRHLGVLRSRSLWDHTLAPPPDSPAPGEVHVHEVPGPQGASLLLVERTVEAPAAGGDTRVAALVPPGSSWRVMVAQDLRETTEAAARFSQAMAAALAILMALLGLAAWAQVAVGLAPMRSLRLALEAVQAGRTQRLEGRFPAEVQPLVDGFNGVLDRHAELVARARTQAGNLAHAIKTPLAALSQAAASARAAAQGSPDTAAHDLARQVQEQVELARRHVDWHLARARAAAAHALPGVRTEVEPAIRALLRVMARVHAERGLAVSCAPITPGLAFAGEVQDFQEIVGNLLDNACKWARHAVQVSAQSRPGPQGTRLVLVLDDDGPGIPAERRTRALARGERLDESVPGSGLGLAIVHELVGLYGGHITLADSPAGGLRVELDLPAS